MSGLLDARAFAPSIKDAIKAEIGVSDVYEYGQVPGSDGNAGKLPPIFVLISIERRNNPQLRLTAQAGSTGWRVSVRSVGRTVDEARWAMYGVMYALDEQSLPVYDGFTTPIQLESDEAPARDDGRYSGVSTFTFAY